MFIRIHKSLKIGFAGLFLSLGLFSFARDADDPAYLFNMDSLHNNNLQSSAWPVISPSGEESLLFSPVDESIRLSLPGYDEGIPYSPDGYLVLDIEHVNRASLVVILEFTRKGDQPDQQGWLHARISSRIGILPGLPTRIVFPLSYLDAQNIFLPKMPRQLKGTLSGNRMEINELDQVFIRLKNTSPDFSQEAFISGIYLFSKPPPGLPELDEPVVDSLGQWTQRDWKGKLDSFGDFLQETGSLGETLEKKIRLGNRSEYLGFQSLRFDSTGYFKTHFDGYRWWLVDPKGYAYLSVAPTGVRAYSHGPVENSEDLFEWLPPDTGLYRQAYAIQRGLKSLSFITVNMMRAWGDDFLDEWLVNTRLSLKYLGFTGSGNWSDKEFFDNSGMPYFYPMTGFPASRVKLFRDFPDVFDPDYEKSSREYAKQLEPLRDDPMMIGYFLGNEPHWAFGDFNLAREMMYKTDGSYTRKRFVEWLRAKYQNDPYLLSAAWGYEFQDFDELGFFILPHEKDISMQAEEDMEEFTYIMIDKYISTICNATREADPNHLNLGLRFAWLSSEACLQTGEYFDIFSLNGYTFPDPPDTKIIVERLAKPVLIGEFHFGSIDRGLPATGIKGVKNQRARGLAYRHYVEKGFSRPEVIGIHYFQWNDQPVTGRFDGENYNIGLVDVTGRLYMEMARQIRKTNMNLFEIASGKKKPFSRIPKKLPDIYY
jgi:hypothetical protein